MKLVFKQSPAEFDELYIAASLQNSPSVTDPADERGPVFTVTAKRPGYRSDGMVVELLQINEREHSITFNESAAALMGLKVKKRYTV